MDLLLCLVQHDSSKYQTKGYLDFSKLIPTEAQFYRLVSKHIRCWDTWVCSSDDVSFEDYFSEVDWYLWNVYPRTDCPFSNNLYTSAITDILCWNAMYETNGSVVNETILCKNDKICTEATANKERKKKTFFNRLYCVAIYCIWSYVVY